MNIIAGNHVSSGKQKKSFDFRNIIIILLAIIAFAAVVIAVWAVTSSGRTSPPDTPVAASSANTPVPPSTPVPTPAPTPVEKLTNSISLPGYGSLSLRANTNEQTLALSNPEENFCWIKISLILEDGTLLWTSDLVAPGEDSDPIVLSAPLPGGEYENTILKYDCFRKEEDGSLSPLNGATSKLTLIVS